MDTGYYVPAGMGIGKLLPETTLHVGGDATIDGSIYLPAVSQASSTSSVLVIEDGIVKCSSDVGGNDEHGVPIDHLPKAIGATSWDDSGIYIDNILGGTSDAGPQAVFDGYLRITSVIDGETDCDRFLTCDITGNVWYRTGDEVLSDIGAQNKRLEHNLDYTAEITPDPASGFYNNVVLEGDATINVPLDTNEGDAFVLRITQSVSGENTVAWDSGYRWSDDIPEPTLTVTSSKTDQFGFAWNNHDGYWDCIGMVQGY